MSTAAMVAMSQAIRHELERKGSTLSEIPDDDLQDYAAIVGAFSMDLKAEIERRKKKRA